VLLGFPKDLLLPPIHWKGEMMSPSTPFVCLSMESCCLIASLIAVNYNAKNNLDTLGLQVQSVVSGEYILHKGDSRVYMELSGNWMRKYSLLSSSSNPAGK
jgi:hypothetical protein